MLYQSRFFEVAEGIQDQAYLYTLEQTLAQHRSAGTKLDKVKEAEAFLSALQRAIPEFPNVKGLGSEADGALVGMGLQDEARFQTPRWRERLAGFLKELKQK
jgi:hypothetical protein